MSALVGRLWCAPPNGEISQIQSREILRSEQLYCDRGAVGIVSVGGVGRNQLGLQLEQYTIHASDDKTKRAYAQQAFKHADGLSISCTLVVYP